MSRLELLKKLLISLNLSAAAAAGAAPLNKGALDFAWGDYGRTSIAFDLGGTRNDLAYGSVVGPDGALYIAGNVQDQNGEWRMGLTKLLPGSGEIDNSFGLDIPGKAYSAAGYNATSITLYNDTLYLGGYKNLPGGSADFAVCKFTVSGIPQPFSGPGTPCVTTSIDMGPLSKDVVNDIAIQPDGKIVLGGYTAPSTDNARLSAFARFNANGTLDNTFGFFNSGRQFFLNSNYTSEEINAIGIASNGKIVGVGSGIRAGMTSSSALLVRMTATGAQDPVGPFKEAFFTFGGDTIPSYFQDMVLLPGVNDDDVVAIGGVRTAASRWSGLIAKVKPVGNLDANFNDGYSLVTSANDSITFESLARQPGGGFLVAGTVFPPNQPSDMLVTRYHEDGVHDTALDTRIDYALPGLSGGFDSPASINVLGNAAYVAGVGTKGDVANVDFVASKLVLDRIFADGFEL